MADLSPDDWIPPDFDARQLLLHHAPPGTRWYRSHHLSRDAIHFGRGGSQRSDSPAGTYGVLYLAADPYGAFMESIGRGVLRTRFVPTQTLRERGLAEIVSTAPLHLMDLAASGGLTRLGAEGSITASLGYTGSQRWSEAIQAHPCQPDGIQYRSRHDPARLACALFDRAAPHVHLDRACGRWADQGTLLGAILDHYGLGTDL